MTSSMSSGSPATTSPACASALSSPRSLLFEHLRQPIAIGGLEVPNRVMMTVHGTRLSPRRFHRYLEERVRGGVGLVGVSAMVGLYDFPLGPGRFFPPYAGGEDAVPPNPLSPEGIAYYDRSIASLQ